MKKIILSFAAVCGLLSLPARAACIDEQKFVPINGIEQWVVIRGEKCENPVLIIVHGGPGNPMTPYAKAIYGPWEKEFTLVLWDQRGSGMTYGRKPPAEDDPLTLELMRDDGIAVTEYALKRLGKRKAILKGASWSSVLGPLMIKARPELYSAYVGTAHMVRHPDNIKSSYARTLELAKAAKDADSIAKLEALGTPPWTNPRNFGILRRVTRKYEAMATDPAPASWWKPEALYATAKYEADYTAGEDYSFLQFVGWKGDGMASKVDAYRLGPSFDVPVFIIQGAEDLVTTPDVARAFYDAIRAPKKEFILLPRVGHDPNPPMVDAQLKLLREKVRPLAD